MKLSLFLARRYLAAGGEGLFVRFATWVSYLGVTIGVLALVTATAMSNGFLVRIREKLTQMNADFTALAGPLGFTSKQLDRIHADLDRSPEVASYADVTAAAVLATSPLHPGGVMVRVVSAERRRLNRVIPLRSHLSEGGEDGLWLGVDLARRLGVGPGDSIDLLAPRLTLSPFGALPRIRSVRVGGVLSTGYYLYDSEYAYADRELQPLLSRGRPATAVLVRLDAAARPGSAFRRRMERRWGPEIRLLGIEEQNREFFRALAMEKLALAIAVGLIVVVAALNIASSLILLVTQKVRDIGLLRSMGLSAAGVRRIFLLQGLAVGAAGALTGLALGWPLVWVLDHYRLIPLNPDIYPLESVPFLARPTDGLWIALFVLVVALAAAWFPARKAASLDPASALRHG